MTRKNVIPFVTRIMIAVMFHEKTSRGHTATKLIWEVGKSRLPQLSTRTHVSWSSAEYVEGTVPVAPQAERPRYLIKIRQNVII